MAANLFDHPYAAVINVNNCNSDLEQNSDTVTNFMDSPRKVLVKENNGASLDILNQIAHSPEFSCLSSKNGLRENGFQIETNSSCNEMDVNESKEDASKPDMDESENISLGEEEKDSVHNVGIKSSKIVDKDIEKVEELDEDIEKTDERNNDNDKKEELDERIGMNELDQDTNVSDSKATEGENLDQNSKKGKISEEKSGTKTDEANTCEQNENDTKEVSAENENDKGTEEMDVSLDDGNEETDDAEEGEVNGSLENSTELTSEIRTGVGNGIVVSVMKKRKGRRKKRKKSNWSKPSPYKIRRVNSGSPKRVSIEETTVTKNQDDTNSEENTVSQDCKVNESSAQTEEGISCTEEMPKSDGADERLRSRRSRTPGKREGYLTGNELDDLVSATDKKRSHERKKSLLFYQGRKSSPGQIKPLTAAESERYSEPLNQGWKRELVYRGADCATKTQADTYYFPPTKGPKLRSMVQIADWLAKNETNLTTDNFTFMRRPIGVDGEVVRNAATSGRSKSALDTLRRKFVVKNVNDSHIHDNNDGQFDKPEIVIERDSDDYLAPIMSAVEKESSGSTLDQEPKRGRPKKKEPLNIPNLDELKVEKVETMQPSNEEVIISPSSKKEKHKATARKSTTQKSFKKSLPFTGIENLCSLRCPGMEGIPPMLHCNVCMCLFHNECVNYYEEDSEFVCLRCKQLPGAGADPFITMKEDNIMKVSNPTLLGQLQKKPASPVQSIVRVIPEIANKKTISSSTGIIQQGPFQQSEESSILPLYKMLPALASSPGTSGNHSSPINYPVLLTKNTSAFNESVSSTASPSVASLMRSVLVSTAPIVSRKSPAISDAGNLKPKPELTEIRPHIKQEPIDDSYQDAIKGNKSTSRRDSTTKASSEALHNLKHVLTTRLANPTSVEKEFVSQKSKPVLPVSSLQSQQQFANIVPHVGVTNSFLSNINTNRPIAISQNLNQPRMAFSLASPTQGQYPQNQEYRIVPIGPPVPLNKLTTRMPLLTGHNLLPMPVRPVTLSPQIRPEKTVNPLNIVTTQEEGPAHGNSGTLVVNAKSITPMNGQLLTLPPPVVKKLTLNKPLALKINNRQITVPPSGFFPSSEGLKVFLPPNTFPTADDADNDVTDVSNEKSSVEESACVSKLGESSAIEKSSAESQPSAKANLDPKEHLNKIEQEVKDKNEVTIVKRMDIKRNKLYGKCCLIQRLYGGSDCMIHIFKHLELKDLVRLSEVCKAWRRILFLPDFWRDVKFGDMRVSDWGKALKYVSKRDVQCIDLNGLSHFEEPNRTWHQLVSSLHEQYQDFHMLKKISFGLVPAAVLQSVVGRLTHLHSLIAESISDFTDDSMWTVPTKIDLGNFRCTTQLKELKLRGTGGLSLPSFSFGCGLADIGRLTTLHTLHLTSLRNLKGSEFNFISNLTMLREIALGDCEDWTQETYAHLQKLTSLKRLRLENGGEIPDTGLGLALSHLTELEKLELIKYTIAYTFGNHIRGLHKLRHLCVFPLNKTFMGEVNTNTCHAVESMKDLETLDWIIPQSSDSSIILDDNSNSSADNCTEEKQQWIPFQTLGAATVFDSVKSSALQYTSVDQLKCKLEAGLLNTKVSVYCAKSERK